MYFTSIAIFLGSGMADKKACLGFWDERDKLNCSFAVDAILEGTRKMRNGTSVITISLVILVLVFLYNLNHIKMRWFAGYMHRKTKRLVRKSSAAKIDLFASLQTTASHDPVLRKMGALKILEIGVGTGTNFVYYPDGTRLTVVDPNPHFRQYYEENRKLFPNICSEDIIVSTGEDMFMITDNSMDAVVVTMVFCSVFNTEDILKQILRVLVPGGKFYFYEHIREFDTKNHSIRGIIQKILTKTRIWPFIMDNCCLDKDILTSIKMAGFSKVEAQYFHAPIKSFVYQVLQPSLKGVAEK